MNYLKSLSYFQSPVCIEWFNHLVRMQSMAQLGSLIHACGQAQNWQWEGQVLVKCLVELHLVQCRARRFWTMYIKAPQTQSWLSCVLKYTPLAGCKTYPQQDAALSSFTCNAIQAIHEPSQIPSTLFFFVFLEMRSTHFANKSSCSTLA